MAPAPLAPALDVDCGQEEERNRENQAAQLNTVQNEANRWNGTCLPGMSRTAGANPNFRDTRWPGPRRGEPHPHDLPERGAVLLATKPVDALYESHNVACTELCEELQLPEPGYLC